MNSSGNQDLSEPPKSDWQDGVYSAVRAGLSLIPIGGGVAVELFQFVVQPSLEKRRMDWMRTVGEAVRELKENKGVNIEELQSNEVFIDTVIQATHLAYRNSQDEKRCALKNAIINAGLPNPPDQSLQQMFLHWLDVFTVWHLRILHLYQNPERWEKQNNRQFERLYMGGASHILTSAYPEMKNQRNFYDQIWKDLYLEGLVGSDTLHVTLTGDGVFQKRTTEFGDKFLNFITN